jgi:hypothetical protein
MDAVVGDAGVADLVKPNATAVLDLPPTVGDLQRISSESVKNK